MSIAYLSLGSNLGDRPSHIQAAIDHIATTAGIRVLAVSQVRETEPVGVTEQPSFLNAALCVETELSPAQLLRTMQALEKQLGRRPTYRWGPRVVDVDILLYDDLTMKRKDLVIPHPEIHNRRFVLEPMAEIAPQVRHPLSGKTMVELLAALDRAEPLASTPSRKRSRKMRVVRTVAALRRAVARARRGGVRIGFVPTMGALHDGHLSLIRRARRETDFVVVSIFVNPTQFGPKEDFARYPRTFAADRRRAGSAGADLIYAPAASEMYPEGFRTYVEVTGDIAARLEGASRPGFFRGVATVVAKLLNQVQPDVAYFGQKDAQQARVVQRTVRDLDIPVRIVVCPTVREADGLAMSSRNRYLRADEREQATALSQALKQAEELFASGVAEADRLKRAMRAVIRRAPAARIDYVEVVDAETMEPLRVVDRPALVALAVFIGTTRLIDNTVLGAGKRGRRKK